MIGAHVGVADGYPAAVDYAASVGCEALQMFVKNPRQWRGAVPDAAATTLFASARRTRGIGYVVTHTAYLINLGSEDPTLWERSWRALADELWRASLYGADATVTHIGTNRGGDLRRGAARVSEAIARALDVAASPVRLLLENTAGAGTTFGSTPEEIGAVLREAGPLHRARLGVCLDTCHAHAAGYDLSIPSGWDDLLDGFERHADPARIEVVHANDSVFPCGSRHDRHAWVGEGTIGRQGFARLFAEDRLADATVIVEMPGEVPEKDLVNISALRQLREACGAPGF
ncbi:MAG: deoxyribonuclease IV [Coriobacteriales bacterium]